MKTKIFNYIVLFALTIFSSCSLEEELVNRKENGIDEQASVIQFQLDQSVCSFDAKSSLTRATAQTDDEKKITTLTAVVFKSAFASASKESGDETFVEAIDINPVAQDGGAFTFKTKEAGNLVICFVANAEESLRTSIGTLEGKNVNDLKVLTSSVDPDELSKLMTSVFFPIKVSLGQTNDLGRVSMNRVMARVDVKNHVDGVTINKIVFRNRAVKSVLYRDNASFDSSVKGNKSYDVNLVGNSKTPSVKTLYSYEQYGTGENAPSLEIQYRFNGKQKAHVIKFEKKKESGSSPIHLKRNYLYIVNVKKGNASIKFNLEVIDWNTGDIFIVGEDIIVEGLEESKASAKVGDFFLSDGTTVDATEITEDQKAKVIGVVYCTDQNRISQAVKDALKNKGINEPHGMVMATKDATSEGLTWSRKKGKAVNQVIHKTVGECYEDVDGYTKTLYIKNNENLGDFPLFNTISTFNGSNRAPEKSTGWYVPSIGEWADILSNLFGIGDISSLATDKSSSSKKKVINKDPGTALDFYNNKIKNLSGADSFQKKIYWSSTGAPVDGGTERVHVVMFNGNEEGAAPWDPSCLTWQPYNVSTTPGYLVRYVFGF